MTEPSHRDQNGFRRMVRLLAIVLAIAATLLAFPSALLWMVACWVAVASVQIVRNGSGWLPLAICAAILVGKRPDWSPALIALVVSLLVGAVALFWQRVSIQKDESRRKYAWVVIGIVWMLWTAAIWESYEGMHSHRLFALDADRPIVCLGDSLTTGMASDEAYPEYLRELISVPVVNFGRAGVTARDMTKHLAEILEGRPQAVVIELGGHDFLRGYGRAAARESLVTIIEACHDADAAVILIEIPRGFIVDPFSGLERELAREYDLDLIPDSAIRLLVVRSPVIPIVGALAKPHLSEDGLHPNGAGARMLAETVYRAKQVIRSIAQRRAA